MKRGIKVIPISIEKRNTFISFFFFFFFKEEKEQRKLAITHFLMEETF